MTAQELVLLNILAAVLLGVTIYFTRATFRRASGAVLGGVAAMLLGGFEGDTLAYAMGWWHYTFVATPQAPVLMYTAAGLWYGAALALIAWRISRRFGWQGQASFILAMTIYASIRDYAVARWSGWVVFAPGIRSMIADAVLWGTIIAFGQGMMRLAAGPARSDGLARSSTVVA